MKFASIQTKIAALSGASLIGVAVSIVAFGVISGNSSADFVARSTSALMEKSAQDLLRETAAAQGGLIRAELENALNAAEATAHAFGVLASDDAAVATPKGQRRA